MNMISERLAETVSTVDSALDKIVELSAHNMEIAVEASVMKALRYKRMGWSDDQILGVVVHELKAIQLKNPFPVGRGSTQTK